MMPILPIQFENLSLGDYMPKMAIFSVDLIYADKKSKGYEIKKGKSSSKSKMNTELTLQSGRKWVKKK
jgi:hypothetical protein